MATYYMKCYTFENFILLRYVLMYDQASWKLLKLGGDNPRESWGEKSEDKVYAPPCLPVSHVPDQCEVFRDNGDWEGLQP